MDLNEAIIKTNTNRVGPTFNKVGESSFEFEVLDELAHAEDSAANAAEELRILTEMWIGKLEKAGSSVVRL